MAKKTGFFVAFFLAASLAAELNAFPSGDQNIVKTETTDGLKIELHVLPAEPFYTSDQVKANPGLEGMLVMGGEEPLQPDAKALPNHHLIVHVFDAKTGKALTDANVSMKYQSTDKQGKPQGTATEVPVVIMQVIGKGAETTHYGNNVVMPDGSYVITVVANGKKAVFHVDVES